MTSNLISNLILDMLPADDREQSDILKRRESTTLELKANFSGGRDAWEEYARTLAAFANRGGGILLFGVTNHPHRIVGMTNDRLTALDPADFTQFLTNAFSPELIWELQFHNHQNKLLGIMYTPEASTKPIVCVQNGRKLRDGDIYYRYRGQTRLIRSGDLHNLIQARVDKERSSWQDLLSRAASISPSATYLLDLESGRASGNDQSFVISPDLVEKIKFIEEGRFSADGDFALRLVGDVEVVRTETIPGAEVEVPVDPSKYCNLWEKDVLRILKDRIGSDVPVGPIEKAPLKGPHIRAVVKSHQILTPSKMYYRPNISGVRPLYGPDLIDWIVKEFQKDNQFFAKAYNAVRNIKMAETSDRNRTDP